MKDVEETQQSSLVCQQEEESVWNTESELFKICYMIRQNHSEFTKNKDSYELIKTYETKESTDFSRSDELLLMICCTALSHSRILDIFYM